MGIAERREREKEQRRTDIMNAAEKIFFSKGLEVATMDEVAETAELSKGTLYLYFQSKEDLLFAIFMRGFDILYKLMQKGMKEENDGISNLLAMAESFVSFSREYKDYFDLIMHFEGRRIKGLNIDEKQIVSYLGEQSPLELVKDQVWKGMEDGSLRSDLPHEVFSATLWSQMLGVLIVLNNKADLFETFNLKADDILRTHLELAISGSRGMHR